MWEARRLPSCQSTTCALFSVVDLVSADLEDVAQKCGLSYKVSYLHATNLGVSKCSTLSQRSKGLPEIENWGGSSV